MSTIAPQALGTTDEPVRSLIRVLNQNRRSPANIIMARLSIPRDVSGFVTFINVVLRARLVLERNGFWLMRTGGKPTDEYWIEPQGLSS